MEASRIYAAAGADKPAGIGGAGRRAARLDPGVIARLCLCLSPAGRKSGTAPGGCGPRRLSVMPEWVRGGRRPPSWRLKGRRFPDRRARLNTRHVGDDEIADVISKAGVSF